MVGRVGPAPVAVIERVGAADALAGKAARCRGIDADVMWLVERERCERAWRHSVAIGSTTSLVFDGCGGLSSHRPASVAETATGAHLHRRVPLISGRPSG